MENMWETGIRGKMWLLMKIVWNVPEVLRCWMEKYQKFADIREGIAQECTQLPNLFKVYLNGMVTGDKQAKEGIATGKIRCRR